MTTVRLLRDDELSAKAAEVFADIRATRGSDFVNNIWRALANDPPLLARTWGQVKEVMGTPGALDPMTREMIYIAVSIANNCAYCVHSHTAAARARGMTEAQHGELMSIVALASSTNALANGMQLPVDEAFLVETGPGSQIEPAP